MDQHPIERLMGTSMESIREMVDVNTVIGDAVQTQDGSTVIPISKVSFGFVAGGGEYGAEQSPGMGGKPFAGGAGAGVSVQPVGFLVCSASGVRLLRAGGASALERAAEMLPQLLTALHDDEEDAPVQERPRVRAAYRES
ncbi:MAG: GerW family sporulation protein [Clostridia bacterium]|nr:GerW family sporulation protein [Clostridia bacterium]